MLEKLITIVKTRLGSDYMYDFNDFTTLNDGGKFSIFHWNEGKLGPRPSEEEIMQAECCKTPFFKRTKEEELEIKIKELENKLNNLQTLVDSFEVIE
jgi:hypothetical protein